ncbi:hypothetical protein [Tunicatimonas pelagia]|uniref:hypothetical protein n=1 Tax=Tunicatimonas pelagia TaxID=931531 RepID=UPI002666794F|nr:hypothetical protein [Tunicatimonas pelagia]WKN41833.1 hypothetical protein P0M28_22600 [Tunicatimonas pelagia]
MEIDSELQTLVQTWSGFAKGDEYRQAWDESLKIAEQHQLTHWLIDQAKLKGVNYEDWQWVNEEWKPRFEQKISESSTAIVLANNIFDEMAGRFVSRKANGKTHKSATGYFADKGQAQAWLASTTKIVA